MRLRDVAHSRTGDKGTLLNCSVIAFDGGNLAMGANATIGRKEA